MPTHTAAERRKRKVRQPVPPIKPTPAMLGTGTARGAADAVRDREARRQKFLDSL